MVALGIIIDRRCNIRCTHCCFSSGPNAEERLSDREVLDITRQGCLSDEVDTIALSGGEALLRRKLVLEVLSLAKKHGKSATLVTNGSWGQRESQAVEMLKKLKSSGLTSLKISFDDFHQDLLKAERVRNILNANRGVRIPIALNVAVSKTYTSDQILSTLGESLMGVKVTKFPIQRVGEAKRYSDDEIIRRYQLRDDLTCPGFEPTYHYDGRVYPCCSPSVFETGLSLGTNNEVSVSRSISLIQKNLLFGGIRNRGFRWIFEECARRRELNSVYLDRWYVDACEMCHTLFSDTETMAGVVKFIREEYRLVPPT